MAYAFPAFLFAMLTLTGFWSLRWTKLDPQYPVPPHPWRIIATSAGAAALVLLSHTGAPLATITAAGAVGMITKTAIIPPVKITAQEVPDWRSRAWRRFSSAALGGVVLSLLLGVGFSISSWLPFSNQLPGWLGAYAILCAISIGTRPVSHTVEPQRVHRLAVTDLDTSPHMIRLRFIALGSVLLWLLLAYPAIEFTFDRDAEKLSLLAAVFGGALLADLTWNRRSAPSPYATRCRYDRGEARPISIYVQPLRASVPLARERQPLLR